MTRTCESCGCPLGAADIEAAQCPACRKTVWRHVVPAAAAPQADFRGTLMPPRYFEPEPEDFGVPLGSGSSSVAEPATGGPFGLEPSAASEADDATVSDARPVDPGAAATVPGRPAGSVDAAPGSTVVLASEIPEDADVALPSRSTRSASGATVDPRNFDEADRRRWAKSLGAASAGAAGMAASGAGTATGGEPGESRYVGKTPVAGRTVARPGQATAAAADYALGSPLGAGGMGVVYEAVQRSIDRTVALKLLRPEVARRRDRRDSLATEAIVTGELTHPNIVPIHDLGQDADGNLFYSMKRVEGARWDEVLGEKSQVENLDIFLKVSDAIAFAHSRGVVHRDLKPENVLLGGFGEVLVMDWGLAYATERFKKLGSITSNTATGGSPAYMAPEQAYGFLVAGGWRSGEVPPVTPAIDVYLLGAILFEIATGGPPHVGDDPAGCVIAAAENRIREVESASGLLPIAMKGMATSPGDRYGSVEELQAAVREYRAHAESVALADRAQSLLEGGDLARAVVGFEDALELWPDNPEATTRVVVARRRLARRRYALTAMTAAFLLAIFGGGLGINHQRLAVLSANEDLKDSIKQEKLATAEAEAAGERARLAKVAAEEAEKEQRFAKEEAQRSRDAADEAAELERIAKEGALKAQRDAEIARADAERERERQRYQNYLGRIKLVDARIEENAFAEADRLLGQLASESSDLCGWEWGRLKFLCTQGQRRIDLGAAATAAAASGDGSHAVTGGADGGLRFVRLRGAGGPEGARALGPAETGFGRVTAVAMSDDGRFAAAAGTGTSDILLFRTASGDAPSRLKTGYAAEGSTAALGFSADGSRLFSAGPGGLVLWDTGSGRPVARGDAEGADPLPVTCAAISRDGRRLAAGLADGQVLVWEAGGGLSVDGAGVFDGHRRGAEFGDGFRYAAGEVTALAFLPDGRTIVSGGDDGRLLKWDVADTSVRDDARDLSDALASAVAARGGAGGLRPSGGRGVAVVPAHDGPVRAIDARVGGDGRATLVTGADDGLGGVWVGVVGWRGGASALAPAAVLRGHEGAVTAVAGFDGGGGSAVTFSAGLDATARIWDVARYGEVRELRTSVAASHPQEILSAAFDPTGRRLLTAGRDESLVLTDLTDPGAEPRRSPKVHGEAISIPWVVPFPDGGRLVTGYFDGSFAIWDAARRTTLARVAPGVGSSLTPPAVSPDGRWIAASWRPAPEDRSVAVWSVEGLLVGEASKPARVFDSRGEVFTAAFTSDGRLAFGDRPGPDRPQGGYVYVADLGSGEVTEHRVFGDGVEGRVYAVRPLPGGELLVAGTAAAGASVRVLRVDTATGKATGRPLALAGGFLAAMSVSRDGGRVVTLTSVGGDRSQSLEAWDSASGSRMWELRPPGVRVSAVEITPQGGDVLVVTEPVGRGDDTASGNGTVRLLAADTGEERRFGAAGDEPFLSSDAVAGSVSGAAFSPDGGTVFLTGIRGVAEWDVAGRRRVAGTFDSRGAVSAAGFSADGRFVIDGHRDGSFEIRDAESARLTPLAHQPGDAAAGPVTAAVFSPVPGSFRFLTAAGRAVSVWEFDPQTRRVTAVRSPFPDAGSAVRDAAFSADGRWVAAACDDGTAWLREDEGDRPPIRLADRNGSPGHVGAVSVVAFPRVAPPEGFQVVATGGADRTAAVWVVDTRDGAVAAAVPLRGHRGAITGLSFFPGRIDALVSVSGDETAKLWDWDGGGLRTWHAASLAELGDPEEVLTLRGPHTAGLTAVDVSGDGLTVVTAGRDGRAVLWPAVAPPREVPVAQEVPVGP